MYDILLALQCPLQAILGLRDKCNFPTRCSHSHKLVHDNLSDMALWTINNKVGSTKWSVVGYNRINQGYLGLIKGLEAKWALVQEVEPTLKEVGLLLP